jgi:hypothetical protein
VFLPRNDLGASQIQNRIFTPLVNLLGWTCINQRYQYGSQENLWSGKYFGMVKMYMVWILLNDMQLLLTKMKVAYYNIRIFMEVEIKFLICIQYWHQQMYTCVIECTNLVYMCAFVDAIILCVCVCVYIWVCIWLMYGPWIIQNEFFVFWVIVLYRVTGCYHCCGEIFCIHHHLYADYGHSSSSQNRNCFFKVSWDCTLCSLLGRCQHSWVPAASIFWVEKQLN